MRLVVLILLLLLPVAASANEVAQLAGAALAIFATPFTFWFYVGWTLLIGSSVYGAEELKRKQREAEEAARNKYNSELQDRTITRIATNAAYRTVYGRARVGSDIVAMFTSGDKDQYRWLVCVHAAHECDAIEDVYINSKALGTLDGSGYVTGGDYMLYTTASISREAHTGATFTLAHAPIANSLRVTKLVSGKYKAVAFTLSGSNVTVAAAGTYYCNYDYYTGTPHVRVLKHLGGDTDPVDPVLRAAFPAGWPSGSVLRGFCYTVIMLDLNQQEFQSGIPTIEVLVRGKKLYDPRDYSTIWNQNPALATYDYLTSETCGVDVGDLPLADFITAANVCDEDIGGGVKRYLVNGTVSSDQDQQGVLESLAKCMAGFIVGTTWSVSAGKYTAPVMALDQTDIVGSVSIVAGTADSALTNGYKGQYISSENDYVLTDYKPYQNAVYLASDERECWSSLDFAFTDDVQHAHNLLRIFVEDQRYGFTVRGIFQLGTKSLRIGDRVTFSSDTFGIVDKILRVTNKIYSPDQAVELTMKEDAEGIWDLADDVVADAGAVSNLPDPWTVGQCGALTIVEAIYETTGSAGVKSKATVSWDPPADVTVISYGLAYKLYVEGDWIEIGGIGAPSIDLVDLAPDVYDFKVRATNALGVTGEYTSIRTATLYGLTAPPADVSGFTITPMAGAALAKWGRTTDLDVKIGGFIVIRFCPLVAGASWEKSVTIAEFNGDAINGPVSLGTGTYYAKFIDSTGHYSDNAASFVATEALVTGWSTQATVTEEPTFSGVKTDVAAVDSTLFLEGATLIDDVPMIDDASYIDSLGGVVSSGEYEFDTILDFGSVKSLRYYGHIKALSFSASDLVDDRGAVDDWPSVDGAVINDTNATLYASVSDDGVAYSDYMPFMVADFSGRYAKFKCTLSSGDPTHNISISELSVVVKQAA